MDKEHFNNDIVHLECGDDFTIALSRHGLVYSFGANTYQDFDVHKIKNGGGDTFNM